MNNHTTPGADAERAAFETETQKKFAAATFDQFPSGGYKATWVQDQWIGWQMRAALASVPAQVVEPVLAQWRPKYDGAVWESCSVEQVEAMRAHNADTRLLYTTPQPAAAQAAPESIDTPEFESLALDWVDARETANLYPKPLEKAWHALIAHINAWGARLAAGTPAETVRPDAWMWHEPASEWNGYEGRNRITLEKPKPSEARNGCTPLFARAAPSSQAGNSEAVERMAQFIVANSIKDHHNSNGPDWRACEACGAEIQINSSTYQNLALEHMDDCLFIEAEKILATNAAARASPPATPCKQMAFSSRICEVGTRACEVRHGTPATPSADVVKDAKQDECKHGVPYYYPCKICDSPQPAAPGASDA